MPRPSRQWREPCYRCRGARTIRCGWCTDGWLGALKCRWCNGLNVRPCPECGVVSEEGVGAMACALLLVLLTLCCACDASGFSNGLQAVGILDARTWGEFPRPSCTTPQRDNALVQITPY